MKINEIWTQLMPAQPGYYWMKLQSIPRVYLVEYAVNPHGPNHIRSIGDETSDPITLPAFKDNWWMGPLDVPEPPK